MFLKQYAMYCSSASALASPLLLAFLHLEIISFYVSAWIVRPVRNLLVWPLVHASIGSCCHTVLLTDWIWGWTIWAFHHASLEGIRTHRPQSMSWIGQQLTCDELRHCAGRWWYVDWFNKVSLWFLWFHSAAHAPGGCFECHRSESIIAKWPTTGGILRTVIQRTS